MDCIDGMKKFPDNYFELAIVDPPYGINVTKMVMGSRKNVKSNKQKNWDSKPPEKDYWKELFRVSKNQIIWGGNYFYLPPTRSFVIWDKGESLYGRSFSEVEYAWTSFNKSARIKKLSPRNCFRIHPTQKPVELYEWLIKNYANKDDKILDTHVGSASSLIACHNYGFKYVGFEIDKEYYQKAKLRLDSVKAQIKF